MNTLDAVLRSGSDNTSVFGGSYEGGVYLQQSPSEIASFLDHLTGDDIGSYLEIGVAAGGLTRLVHDHLAPEKIVIIDDNKHHRAGMRDWVLDGVERDEFIGDSHSAECEAWLEGIDETFDLIFIDGDHTEEGVRQDTLMVLPYAAVGGYVAFHDSELPAVARWLESKEFAECGLVLDKVFGDRFGIALYSVEKRVLQNEEEEE